METKEIVVFLTGGTIAMRSSPLGAVPADDLEASLQEALHDAKAVLRFIPWATKPSPHITPEDMYRLAQDIATELDKTAVYGAIVLHGTDTLAETAFVLDKVLTSPKPVICTGAMRHMEENGYDGIRNVVQSVLACLAMPASSEVLIQMGDFLHTATDAVKNDSMSVVPFCSPHRGIVGRVINGRVQFLQSTVVHRPRLPFTVQGITCRVPLMACYSGMQVDDIIFPCAPLGVVAQAGSTESIHASALCNARLTASQEDGLLELLPQGIVLEAFGAGNIPPGIIPLVEYFLASGVAVVIASRCALGGVAPLYGYEGGGGQLLAKGAFSAGHLPAYKAQLLLKMALASGYPVPKLPEIFTDDRYR